MPHNGSIAVQVYASQAQIPIPGATVTISRRAARGKHTLLAVRITDENGEIAPIPVAAPQADESEHPGVKTPFASLDIRVEHPDYEMETVEDVQVFSGVRSILPIALLPLAEHEDPAQENVTVHIPPQDL